MLTTREKEPLLGASAAPARRSSLLLRFVRLALLASFLYVALTSTDVSNTAARLAQLPESADDSLHAWLGEKLQQHAGFELAPAAGADPECPQQEPLDTSAFPPTKTTDQQYAENLSKAVQVDTSMGDNWPAPSEEPERWDRIFEPFRQHLRETYPRVHAEEGPVKLEIVNRAALIYTWKGTDESLKPILLTAHQDVVPVDQATVGDWEHPPFSGLIDEDGVVWGRGSTDAKAWLVGILTTLEELLDAESGFAPKRTILVAFGMDEEASGPQGAAYIAPRLQEIYGNDSIALLVDEGTFNFPKERFGFPVAAVAVEEKGSLHVSLRVDAPGGHSSFPPPHTSIGIISKLITQIEAKPYTPRFSSSTCASLQMLVCLRNAPGLPPRLRKAIKDLVWARRSTVGEMSSDVHAKLPWSVRAGLLAARITRGNDHHKQKRIERAEQRVLEQLSPELLNPLVTTRAVDLIQGGTKINALPEGVEAAIDSRIATWHSIDEVKADYNVLLRQAAEEFGLKLSLWGEEDHKYANNTHGKITITEWPASLDPAPPTPLLGEDAKAWRLLSSVIRNTYRANADGQPSDDGEGIMVAPTMMQGNTDTRRYWSLTRNIFRYGPNSIAHDKLGIWGNGVHTVNEHYATKHANLVTFYKSLILAVDADREL